MLCRWNAFSPFAGPADHPGSNASEEEDPAQNLNEDLHPSVQKAVSKSDREGVMHVTDVAHQAETQKSSSKSPKRSQHWDATILPLAIPLREQISANLRQVLPASRMHFQDIKSLYCTAYK